jgi:hypothetical protein
MNTPSSRPLIAGVEVHRGSPSIRVAWLGEKRNPEDVLHDVARDVRVAERTSSESVTTLKVYALNSDIVSYQWQRDGVDIPGANQPSLALAESDVGALTKLRCVVSGSFGSDTTTEVAIGADLPPGEHGVPNVVPAAVGKNPVPREFALNQNFPNPFNPSTTIHYAIPRQVHVKLQVFNILGQLVATVEDRVHEPGYYQVMFDAQGLASGIYIYRFEAADYIESRRLTLMK